MKILETFKELPYTGYRRKQAKNQPTKDCSFLVKQTSKILKINKHVLLCTQRVKSKYVQTKNVNETTKYGITLMNADEQESVNVMRKRDSEAKKHEKTNESV